MHGMNIKYYARKVEEEFTVARLFVSKMKSEAKNLVSRATNLEQQQTEANRKCEEMEKDLSECRLTIVQVKKMSYVCSFFCVCIEVFKLASFLISLRLFPQRQALKYSADVF